MIRASRCDVARRIRNHHSRFTNHQSHIRIHESSMLPPTIPIFPLPNVVLFPNVLLPLHIFEPRYRAMVADALKGDRIIGMTLLRPGCGATYEGPRPVS